MINCAYMYLITKEKYLPCILKNAWRMQYLHFQYPQIILLTDNLLNTDVPKILEKNNIQYKVVKYLRFPYGTPIMGDTINKFWALTFTEYDKIIVTEADSITINNTDNVFNVNMHEKDLVMYTRKNNPNKAIGGLFICKPNISLFNYILNYSNNPIVKDDEDVLIHLKQNNLAYDISEEYPLEKYIQHLHFGSPVKLWEIAQIDPCMQHIIDTIDYNQFNQLINEHHEDIFKLNNYWQELIGAIDTYNQSLNRYD